MIEGEHYLVTGATGGIGGRVARVLAESRAKLSLIARDDSKLLALSAEMIQTYKVACSTAAIDFSIDCSERISRLQDDLRPLDGAVIVYPSVPKSSLLIPPPDEWMRALQTCFVNPLLVLGTCIEKLKAGGRVVVVSGIASAQVFPDMPFSNVIRAAWLAEVKTLAFRLGSRGIRINTLSLGGTLTERFATRLASAEEGDIPKDDSPTNIPLGHYGDPDDAAYVVCDLLGRLSNHMTGSNLLFDGGLVRCY